MMLGFLVGFLLVVNCLGYPAQNVNNYKEALKLSLLFFEAQRSGKLPETNRIPWRGDSALNDRGNNGEDLTGGYYDAGDFVKLGITINFAITMLSWSMLTYEDVYRRIGQYNNTAEAIKWGTDYILKCHTGPNEFYAQVGEFQIDHRYWGRPEQMNMSRPAFKIDKKRPGSDVAAEASAALAASSMVFAKIDHEYAKQLLNHSIELFDFASKHPGFYYESFPATKYNHNNDNHTDELGWAAIWLFKATMYTKYANISRKLYKKHDLGERPKSFFYNSKKAGVQLLLAQEFAAAEYLEAVRDFCNYAIRNETRTNKGLLFIAKSGTLAHAADVAFICLQASELEEPHNKEYADFAKEQMDYILGSTGFSYVVGFGTEYPKRPHHAASSCKSMPEPCDWADFKLKKANPQVLYGALVSGPTEYDHYEDDREEYLYNEVTIDYNAGFQSLLAALLHREFTQM